MVDLHEGRLVRLLKVEDVEDSEIVEWETRDDTTGIGRRRTERNRTITLSKVSRTCTEFGTERLE